MVTLAADFGNQSIKSPTSFNGAHARRIPLPQGQLPPINKKNQLPTTQGQQLFEKLHRRLESSVLMAPQQLTSPPHKQPLLSSAAQNSSHNRKVSLMTSDSSMASLGAKRA
jgi:hypothetical protein